MLTAWDLVLDPAMADPGLKVQFWTWPESGPYFGMPVQNLIGWSLTGLLYMGLSRLLWGSNSTRTHRGYGVVSIHRVRSECLLRHGLEPGRRRLAPGPARGARGLAAPGSPSSTLALAPTLAVARGTDVARLAEPLATRIADHAIRGACRLAARRIDLRVEGLEHLPATGPAIIAARHFHHFYDGCALVAVVPGH